MTVFPPQRIRNLGVYGVIREAEVDSYLIPDGAVVEAVNVHFDRQGAVQSRPGLAAIGATVSAGNSPLGLHNAQSSTLVAAFSSSIYNYSDSGTWDAGVTGLTSGQTTRFVDFAGRTIAVNGSYDSIHVWNGSNSAGWVTTGAPINPDQFKSDATVNTQTLRAKFIEVFQSRLYLAGDPTTPDRLFFSAVINSSGNLTWTPSTDYVDINPSDGENITALKRYSLELDVFKPNYIYRFRTTGTDPDPLIKIGTRSQESIVEGKNGLYFFHDTGFYVYTGGYPTEISRPISDIITAIPYSQYSKVAGWKDANHIYWWLGTLTINDPLKENVTWPSVVVRYTESSQVWTIYSYQTDLVKGITYNSGSALSQAVGLSTGVVATLNSGTTDLSEPIKYRMITKWYEWGVHGISNQKVIQQLISIFEKSEGAILMYQVNDDKDWTTMGEVTKFLNFFQPSSPLKFYRIRFKLTGVITTESLVFRGIEATLGFDEDIIKNKG